ncbi:hypothetical protein MSAN_00896600 [Mycena sanguinolenta]|uniref:DUF6534 domain-containing protein n=1 Tax=Mycena sanguinolenta TaxID=230812 RepID=A0A8H7D8Q7_9AGAR|nr:hypothetical protein MSAN_00896600 [Mycena sanguinolenta]
MPMLPSFDNTLGALYIGLTLSTVLYGVICVQTFLYLTSRHAKVDSWKLMGMVLLVLSVPITLYVIYVYLPSLTSLLSIRCIKALYSRGCTNFLISDFVNPAALPVGGPSSGEKLTSLDEGFVAVPILLMIQWFFCYRLWMISAVGFRMPIRVALVALAISLSLLNSLAILGYHHRLMMENPPSYILSWKISTTSGIAFDSIITVALSTSLWRSRSGIKRSDHVVKLLIFATVNTGLITTSVSSSPNGYSTYYLRLLSIADLTTFLALPNATVYGAISFIVPTSYVNLFLATLNSREFLRDKLEHETIEITPISVRTVQFQQRDTANELQSSKREDVELFFATDGQRVEWVDLRRV